MVLSELLGGSDLQPAVSRPQHQEEMGGFSGQTSWSCEVEIHSNQKREEVTGCGRDDRHTLRCEIKAVSQGDGRATDDTPDPLHEVQPEEPSCPLPNNATLQRAVSETIARTPQLVN
ncbi:hypothetical protein EYF80_066468 [Liparis tanakae]|uniref:Uncharacterized protein n=1 Tax=Liparis tanakae TaxID=230148 RepID=A0A4Z2E4Z4_9TELE|nr:hypothetical protein EYF80_066468 [Liparis tanakae]